MTDAIRKAIAAFPFEYVGGGYWRRRGAAPGQKADILHGSEALEAFARFVLQGSV